jgi:hypothetical protein
VALMLAPINGQPPVDRARNAAVDASSTAV